MYFYDMGDFQIVPARQILVCHLYAPRATRSPIRPLAGTRAARRLELDKAASLF